MLKLIAEGYTAREIADMLSLSVRTVESHKSSLMRKLNIRSKTDLIKFAIRKGVITV
jgi:two-component system response regulator NreC